jgi:hypothetical protein
LLQIAYEPDLDVLRSEGPAEPFNRHILGFFAMSDATIITLRLPKSLVDRADALIDELAEDEEALLLGRVSRSIVLRLAVLRGLESLEGQVQARADSRASGKKARGRAAR